MDHKHSLVENTLEKRETLSWKKNSRNQARIWTRDLLVSSQTLLSLSYWIQVAAEWRKMVFPQDFIQILTMPLLKGPLLQTLQNFQWNMQLVYILCVGPRVRVHGVEEKIQLLKILRFLSTFKLCTIWSLLLLYTHHLSCVYKILILLSFSSLNLTILWT